MHFKTENCSKTREISWGIIATKGNKVLWNMCEVNLWVIYNCFSQVWQLVIIQKAILFQLKSWKLADSDIFLAI